MGPYFMPTVAGSDGRPLEEYLMRAHPRLMQMARDTCERPYDQDWLDYQHEIGLRHHRAKKNQTDHVESTPVVPFRYLPVSVEPVAQLLRPFLEAKGHSAADFDAMVQAFTKSLLLQVTLWSRAYVAAEDW